MDFHVFTWFVGAFILSTECASLIPLRITHNPSEFIYYSDYPDALVVRGSNSFNLKCEGTTHVNWTFPEHEFSEVLEKVNISGWTQNDNSVYGWGSNINVKNAQYMDSGYYECRNDDGTNVARKYIYIRDEDELVTKIGFSDLVTQYQSTVIPCRPTSPDVTVTLEKEGNTLVPGNGDSYGNIQVSFDPTIGFTLSNINLIDGGIYECKAVRKEDGRTQDSPVFRHISVLAHTDVVPKPSINGSSILRIVANSTLVLECRVTTNLDVGFHMDWNIPNMKELGSDRIINHNATKKHLLDDNETKKIVGTKLLTIKNTQISDTGPYTCIITDHTEKNSSTTKVVNVTGADVKYLNLKVQGDQNVIETTAAETPDVQWVVLVFGHPKPKLEWRSPDNKIIPEGRTGRYLVNTTEQGTILKIHDIMISDSGVYMLRNRGEIAKSVRVTLLVKVVPSIQLTVSNEDSYYSVHHTYNITCEVTAYPVPVIKWYFKRCDNPPNCMGEFVPISQSKVSESKVSSIKTVSSHLRVAELSGYIMCTAKNSEGSANQTTAFWVSDIKDGFEVWKPPEIVEGDNVVLGCGVSKYNYTNDITWLYRPQPVSPQLPLTSNGSDYILEDQSSPFSYKRLLKFNSISMSRNGIYMCQVVFIKGGTTNKNFPIIIDDLKKPKLEPADGMNDGGEILATIGDAVVFTCHVLEGNPKPIITWYKDGTPIKPSNDYELSMSNTTLNIRFAKETLEGVYKCEAVNRAGNAFQSSTLKLKDERPPNIPVIVAISIISIILVMLIIFLVFKIRKEQKLREDLKAIGLDQFEKGALDSINTDLPIDEQAELLPYDKKWEFPRDKLTLGKQLGAGAFGVVVKAEATGISDTEDVSTVAVKMVKRNADYTYIKALASELKIMVHLGKHLNVVNLLGACTKNLTKRELLVIVEYCRFGNLHNYLLRHRSEFIDQVDPTTGIIDPNLGADIIARHESMVSKSSRSDSDASSDYLGASGTMPGTGGAINSETVLISMTPTGGEDGCMMSNNSIQPEWRTNYRGDYKCKVRPICTRDLLCWAFQVARGMEYLAGRKVLHGDLAARNILLSDNNVVKICDFGLAKSMYKDDNYKKKGDGPLPIKWMAVESIRDRVFSTQSDIWSFGIVLWEFFSLARTPYPGMEADEKLYNKLVEGYRMDKPEFATDEVYRIMDNCWLVKPTDRPSFTDLSVQLGNMLENSVRMHYVDLNDPYTDMNTSKWKQSEQSDYLAMMTAPTYDNMVAPVGEGGRESVHQYANGYLVPRPSTSFMEAENAAGYLCMSPVEKESTIFSPSSIDNTIFNFAPLQRQTPDDVTKSDELKPMLSPNNHYKNPSSASSTGKRLNKETGENSVILSDDQTKMDIAPSFSNPSYQTMGTVNSTPENYVNLPDQKKTSQLMPSDESNLSSSYVPMTNPSDQILFTNTKDKEGLVTF